MSTMTGMSVVASELPPPGGESASLGNLCKSYDGEVCTRDKVRQKTSGAQSRIKSTLLCVCVLEIPGRSSCGW